MLTLLYSLYGLFLKRETLHGFNRIVLLAILVASMVLPFVQIETRQTHVVTEIREVVEAPLLSERMDEGFDTMVSSLVSDAPEQKSDINLILLAAILVYFIGLIVVWGRYLWQLSSLFIIIHQGKPMKIEGLDEKLPKGVRVLVHPAIKTPCSWMRWVLLNPSDASLITPLTPRNGAGGEALLLHELSHIRLGHSWDILFCELTCRMLWCVPFAWMLRQDLRDVHEYQADRRVLKSGINEEEYQLLLIRKATSTGLQPVVNALNQSPIKRRFIMMYKHPSSRWLALKAVYLVPLSALAVVAFARPQTMSEIAAKVETTETEVTQAIAESKVIEKVKTVAEDLGLKEREAEPTEYSAQIEYATDSVITSNHDHLVADNWKHLPDANLVKADLAESQPAKEAFMPISGQRAHELLDSTMQAVGARKIADGTWIGHFQPSLNNDTVRISKIEFLDKQSRLMINMSFAHNEADPYAYNMLLQQETRKERTGYYIRKLYPAKATERHYDQTKVDTHLLSTDRVLTKQKETDRFFTYKPIAIERSKKETRIFRYVGFGGYLPITEMQRQYGDILKKAAIVDEKTGDKYICRSIDYSYLKHVKEEYIGKDTINVYQVCLVFPPIGKHVEQAHFGRVDDDGSNSSTFNLKEIPNKPRIITQ